MKVFLSSTYVDLIEHRKEAVEAMARLGRDNAIKKQDHAKTVHE